MKGSKNNETIRHDYKLGNIPRAKEVKEGVVSFDMTINGITIYGCWYKECTGKDGKEYQIISFPQEKGADGKYYNKVWFPISNELKEVIITMLQELV